jgi:hypothetical protein
MQSHVSLNLCRSLASAKPSLHAKTCIVSGPEIPSSTNAEAPGKFPVVLWATTTAEATFKLLDAHASTLIFVIPSGGANHRELVLSSAGLLCIFGFLVVAAELLRDHLSINKTLR